MSPHLERLLDDMTNDERVWLPGPGFGDASTSIAPAPHAPRNWDSAAHGEVTRAGGFERRAGVLSRDIAAGAKVMVTS